ncbi:hypothetical protein HMPREF9193_00101 [Treponema lecithinolyticum ATCC 700332]|uniref:Uncharacterized protein n=1 Tax=Treponema lecithinolyticum ATCC 700332 TaxID=1321815 RepID=A0ABN0P2Q5_TRELE|nr:hypothetical protein HMPREF9193_00101 [Treponema lecithinolyticum ATCC 700332]
MGSKGKDLWIKKTLPEFLLQALEEEEEIIKCYPDLGDFLNI